MSSGFDFSAFIAGFQEEAEERLQAIDSTLVDLEKGEMDADQLEKLRRDAHSVKGSANMLQLQDIGETAHVLEDTFAYLRDGTVDLGQTHINFMFELLDSLRSRIREADDPEAPQLDPDAFRDRLENLDSEEASAGAARSQETAVAEPQPEPEPEPESAVTEEPSPSPGPQAPSEAEPEGQGLAVEEDFGGEAELDPELELELPDTEQLQSPGQGEEIPASEAPGAGAASSGFQTGAEPVEEEGTSPSAIRSEEPEEEAPEPSTGIDRTQFVPGLREEAEPVLEQLKGFLSGAESGEGEGQALAAELESVSASSQQIGLDDVGEAVDLMALVLRSIAAQGLPSSLRELLQGLVDRVGKRLKRADQADAQPLDLDRIRQARALLEQKGMLKGGEGGESPGSPEKAEASQADSTSEEVEESGTDTRPESSPEEMHPISEEPPAIATGGEGESVGTAEEESGQPEAEPGEPPSQTGSGTAPPVSGKSSETEAEEPPAVASGGAPPKQQRSRGTGAEMDVSAFLDGFQAEAREDLNALQDGLLKSERGDADDEALEQLAQRAHSLKGSANMLGLNDLGEGSEVLEDGLGYLRSNKLGKAGLETLLGLHDALSEATEQIQDSERPRVDARYWKRRLEEGGQAEPQTEAPDKEPAPEAETAPSEAGKSQARSAQPSSESRSRQAGTGQKDTGDNRAGSSQSAEKGKSSSGGGSLRVSADRLERLSESVIGLAMDRATQEGRREELDKIESAFRELRRQWEWFEGVLPRTGSVSEQQDKMAQQMANFSQLLNRFRQETDYDISSRHALYDQIHQRVMDLQVSPLSTIFAVLPRSARDLAQRFQKRVELHIEGGEMELERKNVDALLEPLVHLVTNSISHGIEDPEQRQAAGKDPVGHIWVTAEQVGGEVAITIEDDGRGIDYEKVRQTAIRTGVTTPAEAESMLPYDLLQMLFRPGFTTKEEVSQISGRGIGMNAVRDAVQRMTGSIQVDSEVGEGTSFTLNIPVSTAVQRVLKFRVGDEIFGVLANQVDQIMTLNDASLTERHGQRVFEYEGSQVPATWLTELFNLGEAPIQDTHALRLVVVRHLEGYIGFVVHEVIEETQAVIKDVTNYLRRHAVQGLIGTTISGSGDVQLLLEPTGIKEMERTAPLTLQAEEGVQEDPLQGLRVLLVEDSPLARKMEKAVLENSGMEVDTAVDGLDALDRMEVRFPDIVIADVEMPRMDGYDLVRKLRDDDRYRGIPVFMVTSRDSQEDRDTAKRLGADGFLNKMDLQSGNLIEEIRDHLEQLYA